MDITSFILGFRQKFWYREIRTARELFISGVFCMFCWVLRYLCPWYTSPGESKIKKMSSKNVRFIILKISNIFQISKKCWFFSRKNPTFFRNLKNIGIFQNKKSTKTSLFFVKNVISRPYGSPAWWTACAPLGGTTVIIWRWFWKVIT